MLKKILIGLVVGFILIQFIRPAKNLSSTDTYHLSTKYPVPDTVAYLLSVSCNDCHSNYTKYPWYSEVQPAAWWLANHVKEGKEHLNFSEFTNRKISYQNHKFEEIIEMVDEKEMPLNSYTWFGLHPEADLTDGQRKIITDWAASQMNVLKETYPADSLVMKRR